MKRLFFLTLTVLYCSIAMAQGGPAPELANKIARKMKDTLLLTDQQRVQLYDINIQLSDQKLIIRGSYTNSDSLRTYTQRIENSRDSLYRTVLTEQEYLLYREKKKFLVNSN